MLIRLMNKNPLIHMIFALPYCYQTIETLTRRIYNIIEAVPKPLIVFMAEDRKNFNTMNILYILRIKF